MAQVTPQGNNCNSSSLLSASLPQFLIKTPTICRTTIAKRHVADSLWEIDVGTFCRCQCHWFEGEFSFQWLTREVKDTESTYSCCQSSIRMSLPEVCLELCLKSLKIYARSSNISLTKLRLKEIILPDPQKELCLPTSCGCMSTWSFIYLCILFFYFYPAYLVGSRPL